MILKKLIWLLDHPKVSLPAAVIVGGLAAFIDQLLSDLIELMHWNGIL